MPDALDRDVVLQVSLGFVALALPASLGLGCGRLPRFDAGHAAPLAAWDRPSDSSYWNADQTLAPGKGDESGPSRYAARQLAPGGGFAAETPPGLEFLEWLFDEDAPPLDIEPYLEYLQSMSFADVVRAALASIRIPLGRNTTAELSIGLNAAGGGAPPWVEAPEAPEGEWPEETAEELRDVFGQVESVFIGLDVPLPGRVRSRLAVGLCYGWEAEVDPDAPEMEPLTWTLDVKYRAWFW